MEALSGLFAVLIMLVIYFLPSFIARERKHKSVAAIFVTNLLLGVTVAGWIFALIWAFTGNVHDS